MQKNTSWNLRARRVVVHRLFCALLPRRTNSRGRCHACQASSAQSATSRHNSCCRAIRQTLRSPNAQFEKWEKASERSAKGKVTKRPSLKQSRINHPAAPKGPQQAGKLLTVLLTCWGGVFTSESTATIREAPAFQHLLVGPTTTTTGKSLTVLLNMLGESRK